MSTSEFLAGGILAGGRSTRMGGGYKATLDLAGKPMVGHVLSRLEPQVGQLLLIVEQGAPDFEAAPCTRVEDIVPSHRGPLAGLYSLLQHLHDQQAADWLLMVPCDAPFLPENLATIFAEAAEATGKPVVNTSY